MLSEFENLKIFNKDVTNYINNFKLSPICNYLDAQELNMIFYNNQICSFKKGMQIIAKGEKNNKLFIILHGQILLKCKIMGQKKSKTETLNIGDFFGHINLIEQGINIETCIAKTSVDCLAISPAYFNYLYSYFPAIQFKMLKAIIEQKWENLKNTYFKVTNFMNNEDIINTSFIGKIPEALDQPRKINITSVNSAQDILYKTKIWQSFNYEELNTLLNICSIVSAPKNYLLLHEINNLNCYAIIQGAVQSSIIKNNKIAKLSVLGPGNIFTHLDLIYPNPTFNPTFFTCEHAILLKITEKNLNLLYQQHQKIWHQLFLLIWRTIITLTKALYLLDLRLHIETYHR